MGSEGKIKGNVLVTGGAGFIGSHTVLQLLKEGFFVSVIDNLDNSLEEAVHRVRVLAGPHLSQNLRFHLGDIRSKDDLEEMVFSSSATVYGQPEKIPCVEDFKLKAMNPYGRTKLFLEDIAHDIQKADPEWRIILLRYFNPVGAHESGLIGEDPKGIPNNLMPYIQQVAVGRLPELNVYGYDYPTKDGSAIRDYIHVMDLADGHIAALYKVTTAENIGCVAYNLGTGRGTSVLEMVNAFEKVAGKKIPIKLCPRRPGDATAVYASTEKAQKELGWKARYAIEEMCRDQWNWAIKNPFGYRPRP
ncbi:hypothetical protein OPV22_007311 [Ensete ventricosum]|uniref:UDP-glucose 4-epimerase n=1 Tax=Ensete ventricosum TaxID=4639 RepID=A0AAV8RH11_ENSVE|nr:hypothetical protein OPV22_007311 [Ensete ventricosum]